MTGNVCRKEVLKNAKIKSGWLRPVLKARGQLWSAKVLRSIDARVPWVSGLGSTGDSIMRVLGHIWDSYKDIYSLPPPPAPLTSSSCLDCFQFWWQWWPVLLYLRISLWSVVLLLWYRMTIRWQPTASWQSQLSCLKKCHIIFDQIMCA